MSNSPFILDHHTRQELVALCRKSLLSGMSLGEIQKKIASHFLKLKVTAQYEKQKEKNRPNMVKSRLPAWIRLGAFLLPLVLLGSGLYLVSLAVMPILGYYLDDAQNATESSLKSPLPRQYMMDLTPLAITSLKKEDDAQLEPEILDLSLDYTNLANWFVDAHLPELDPSMLQPSVELTEYTIAIPALQLTDVMVKVGGSDLNQSLIAYPGTALPGEYGSPVIFGHSVLRKFYNPNEKNPRRYNSIFSYIMTLEPGKDTIIISAGEKKYTYLVQEKTEVKPEDVYILTQQYDAKRLKLVTCVPEGTYLRRGVITAQLIEESK